MKCWYAGCNNKYWDENKSKKHYSIEETDCLICLNKLIENHNSYSPIVSDESKNAIERSTKRIKQLTYKQDFINIIKGEKI